MVPDRGVLPIGAVSDNGCLSGVDAAGVAAKVIAAARSGRVDTIVVTTPENREAALKAIRSVPAADLTVCDLSAGPPRAENPGRFWRHPRAPCCAVRASWGRHRAHGCSSAWRTVWPTCW